MRAILVPLLSLAVTGCNTVGNLLIAPHPNSLAAPEPKASIASGRCEEKAVLKAAIDSAEAIGVAVSLVQRLLEAEAKRYRASYSAASSRLLVVPGCLRMDAAEVANLTVDLSAEAPAFRLENGRLQVSATKAKVAAWPVLTIIRACRAGRDNCISYPWSRTAKWDANVGNALGLVNPLMIGHALYSAFDSGAYKVDVVARIRIDSVYVAGNQTRLSNLAQVDLKAGKVSIFDLPFTKDSLKSGFLPLVYAPPVGLDVPAQRPANVVVTIVEANDFGDVVGKAADQVGERRGDIIDRLTDWLGL